MEGLNRSSIDTLVSSFKSLYGRAECSMHSAYGTMRLLSLAWWPSSEPSMSASGPHKVLYFVAVTCVDIGKH